ncbi:MAG TPA: YfiR family protein [Candidatus Acidoferrales bacterium]|nr:YfiR family protein [Candidatus Acidoferrales bacterium]
MQRLANQDRSGADGRAAANHAGLRSRVLLVCLLPILAVLLSVTVAGPARLARAQSQAGEYHVKAAFLFHFVQLVEWPGGEPGNQADPLTLCMLGEDPFRGDLEVTLEGKSVGSRPLRVRHLKPAEGFQGCQVLFVGRRDAARLGRVLEELKDGPTLTVGESDGFVEQGGMIGFCLVENKVRFEINVQAAEQAKLRISSRLLLLAQTVIGNHE